MPITPDTKDWTWVLERPCPECGFDTRSVRRDAIPAMIRDNAADWEALLSDSSADALRTRAIQDRWSTLEYACHVRDVLHVFDRRVQLMLDEQDPAFPNWDQDATAIDERYLEQDPLVVASELASAAHTLARSFTGLSASQWLRTGGRSDGARFTIESLGRYLIHDPVHHLHDVTAPH